MKELEKAMVEIEAIGKKMGLDFYDMVYEIVPSDVLSIIGSFGLPNRFSHWTFGKAYQQMRRSEESKMSKIFELVINTNPCIAFLLDANSVLENKLIIAHVLGHSDFFKRNVHFEDTDKLMHLQMKKNAYTIEELEEKYGESEVERVLDDAIMIEEQSGLLDILINEKTIPQWKRTIFQIVQEEFKYFKPQAGTKIINEGWATYWHTRIMRELDLSFDDSVAYSKLHASITKPMRIGVNPYRLGYYMFRNIEKNHGEAEIFKAREECNDYSFIKRYFTKEVAEELNMYAVKKDKKEYKVDSKEFEKIKASLIASRVNNGYPRLTHDVNEKRVVITHVHDGVQELLLNEAEVVLTKMQEYLPQDHVILETVVHGKAVELSTEKGKKNLHRRYVDSPEEKKTASNDQASAGVLVANHGMTSSALSSRIVSRIMAGEKNIMVNGNSAQSAVVIDEAFKEAKYRLLKNSILASRDVLCVDGKSEHKVIYQNLPSVSTRLVIHKHDLPVTTSKLSKYFDNKIRSGQNVMILAHNTNFNSITVNRALCGIYRKLLLDGIRVYYYVAEHNSEQCIYVGYKKA